MYFSTLFQYALIRRAWHPKLFGHYFPEKRLPYAFEVINVVSNFYVFIIPIFYIWSLNMKLHRKLRLLSIYDLKTL